MKRALVAGIVVLLIGGAAVWWRIRTGRGGALVAPAAALTVRWYGSTHGTMTLPARLRWCPVSRTAILEAISGDSGMAVVFLENDSLASGSYGMIAAGNTATAARPAVTAALRWMRMERDTALVGMRAQSGSAKLLVAHGLASGDVTARMRAVVGTDTIVARASFRSVPVVTTATGCT